VILPGKHLPHDRALLGVGAEILARLDEDCTVSELWERVLVSRGPTATPLSFDWFVLALTFLYSIAAIEYDGIIIRAAQV
jgi:hypothetical protein